MISILMKFLLNSQPKMNFSSEEIAVYEALIPKIHNGQITSEDIPFPKYRFLQYVASKEDFVFHGSNNVEIDVFEPRKQTLFNSQLTEAVFASSDPLWATFYAAFDRSKLVGNFRNGCLVHKDRKYHYYSLNKATKENGPWRSGMIYIFHKDKFIPADNRKIRFDEWVCHDFVKPVSRLEISAEDFYYLHKVATHSNNESIIKTLLLYKKRTLRSKRESNVEEE